jgi:hypothetical protein
MLGAGLFDLVVGPGPVEQECGDDEGRPDEDSQEHMLKFHW